jgi:hypothetical protein
MNPSAYTVVKSPVNLKTGKMKIANIATIIGDGKLNCAMIEQGASTVSIPIPEGDFASLVFLQSAMIDAKYAKSNPASWREWIYGFPVGRYLVKYSDGTEIKLKLRDGQNIHWLNSHPFFRATNDCRYTYPIKDILGNDLFLYQWEWVNPHPEKQIESVRMEPDNILKVTTMLFAVSGRFAKKESK